MVVLLIGPRAIADVATRDGIGRVVSGTLARIFSFGLVRLAIDYGSFAGAASVTLATDERELDAHRSIPNDSAAQQQREDIGPAILAMGDYQVARAGAPRIPTPYYLVRRDELNALWRDYLGPLGPPTT